MNKKIIISMIAALSLTAGGSVFAQDHDHDRQDHHDSHNQHAAHHDQRHDSRGAGPHHEFHRGDHISSQYRHKQYVVNDWRGHHLHQPPRGYHWVQTGPDYALIAVTTGIIAQIVLSN